MPTSLLGGKSALVTGAAHRIGREIALALARAGADVAITYRTSHAAADQTASDIAALGCRALAIECDGAFRSLARLAIDSTVTAFGRLDIPRQ